MVIEMVKGHKFSDPVKLKEFIPKDKQGIYVIYYGHSSGKKFCYIGSTEDMSKRGFPFSHDRISSMIRKAGSKDNLYISVHYMPESSKEKYLELERYLIDTYDPPCNRK